MVTWTRKWGEVDGFGIQSARFLAILNVRNERKREIKDNTNVFSLKRMELCVCIQIYLCVYICVYSILNMIMSVLI